MASDLVLDAPVASAKNTAWWLYIIHAVSFVFSLGAFSFIPLIINYVKRPDTAGTFVHSHHSWQIRSFWWYLVWMFIGGVLWFTIIGIPLAILVWCAAWLWKAYRLVKGIVDLNENRAMP
jgi:uncharacterized membrane protein